MNPSLFLDPGTILQTAGLLPRILDLLRDDVHPADSQGIAAYQLADLLAQHQDQAATITRLQREIEERRKLITRHEDEQARLHAAIHEAARNTAAAALCSRRAATEPSIRMP